MYLYFFSSFLVGLIQMENFKENYLSILSSLWRIYSLKTALIDHRQTGKTMFSKTYKCGGLGDTFFIKDFITFFAAQPR